MIAGSLQAQIPRTLSFHGVLTDSQGNPRPDGVYTFTFRLYEVSNGGTAIWTEIKDLVVKRGLFSTTLADLTPFGSGVDFTKQYWLGIKPGADPELAPRLPLASTTYSLNSLKADVATQSLSAPPACTAGGDLTGTYPNPVIATSAVTSAKILDGTIATVDMADGALVTAKIADNSVNSTKIVDGTILFADINQNGATSG